MQQVPRALARSDLVHARHQSLQSLQVDPRAPLPARAVVLPDPVDKSAVLRRRRGGSEYVVEWRRVRRPPGVKQRTVVLVVGGGWAEAGSGSVPRMVTVPL